MHSPAVARPLATLAIGLALLSLTPPAAAEAPATQPWLNQQSSALERANALLATMTFDQKVAVALGDFASVASLGIPAINSDDGPNGVRSTGTTAFPSAQTLAATFDRDLATAYGQAIGAEARGKGFNAWLAPAQDIARTPLAGRQPENLGEDPFLAGHTVAAEVGGVKSQAVIATLKHYVGNNQDFQRIGFQLTPNAFQRGPAINDVVSERALQEIYETPFRIAVQTAGADAVMCSYNRVNGLQTCESPAVLGTLKNDWGFNGYVVPDFGFAVRDVLAATNAGVDLPALGGAGGRTAAMFSSGQVSPERLDDIVRRILFGLFDSGAFDHPLSLPQDTVSTPAHRDLATHISQSGMVLLKNDRDALPLTEGRLGSVAVIGPSGADAIFVNGGSATVPVDPATAVTPLAGIAQRAGSGVSVSSSQGSLGDAPLPTLVPASVLTPPSGSGAGLLATYWNTVDFSGAPALVQVEPGIDHPSTPAGVSPLWSARWSGTLTPPETGLYRFSLLTAGLASISIDGHVIATGYREATQFIGGPDYPIQGVAQLRAGRKVSIQVEYSVKAQLFGPQIHLSWQTPSASLIPAAVQVARNADAAIVLVNEAQGEGMDRSTLALPGDQDALIEAVAAVNRRTIVVLNTGGPVLMPWLNRVEAVLEAWYPGQQFGTALAGVLWGDVDAAGHLPVTFPANDHQGPAAANPPASYPGVDDNEQYAEGIDVGYRWYDDKHQRPLFPFGFGLSYSRIRFEDLEASVNDDGQSVQVTARVTNTGDRRASAVAQLYLAFPPSAHEPPVQLKGYARSILDPGATQRLHFILQRSDLSFFDSSSNSFQLASGTYTVELGASSRDIQQRDNFKLRDN
jgi:beta-glucosidase